MGIFDPPGLVILLEGLLARKICQLYIPGLSVTNKFHCQDQ